MRFNSVRLRPLLLATCVPACWGIGSEVAAAPTNSLSPRNPAGPAWEAQRRAVQLLEAALEAHGASDPAKIRTVELKRKGTRTLFNQSPDWKKPPVLARQRATIIYDSVGRLFIEDREEFDVPGGFRLTTQRALGPDGGWQVDPQRRGTGDFAQRAEAAGWGAAELAFIRTTPPLMIRHALTRASSLRFRGRVVEEGQSFDLVDMADTDGTMLTLRFDGESSRLAGYDLLGDDLIAGDQLTEVHFTYYRSIGGVWLPAHRQEIRNGQTVLDHRLDWTLNVAVPEQALTPPSGYRPAAENPPEPDNLKLAEGVWLLQNLPGENRVLLVEFAQHVGLVETPGPAGSAAAAIERLKELTPGKPIKWVSYSHHHSDHGGALRPYVALGAEVIVPTLDAGFVQQVVATPHTLVPDALARKAVPLKLRTFDKRVRLADSTNEVELIQVGPNSHTESMIVAWLPRQRILFQGDLLNLPDAGSPAPAIQLTIEGLQAIKRLGLEPLKIAGVHGEVGTLEDWQREVDARSSASSVRGSAPRSAGP